MLERQASKTIELRKEKDTSLFIFIRAVSLSYQKVLLYLA